MHLKGSFFRKFVNCPISFFWTHRQWLDFLENLSGLKNKNDPEMSLNYFKPLRQELPNPTLKSKERNGIHVVGLEYSEFLLVWASALLTIVILTPRNVNRSTTVMAPTWRLALEEFWFEAYCQMRATMVLSLEKKLFCTHTKNDPSIPRKVCSGHPLGIPECNSCILKLARYPGRILHLIIPVIYPNAISMVLLPNYHIYHTGNIPQCDKHGIITQLSYLSYR